jgi:hypothetical protein
MTIIEIKTVRMASLKGEKLLGRHLASPKAGGSSDVHAIDVSGWVVGRQSRVTSVEVRRGTMVLGSIPVTAARRDIAARYPEIPGAEISGFAAAVSLLGIIDDFDLLVQAVMDDGTRAAIATISGTRVPIAPSPASIHPLMITTLGRTGSTWLTRLLGQHPRIVAYRPFLFEPRVGTYWLQILRTFSHPASYLQVLGSEQSEQNWWLGRPVTLASKPLDNSIRQFLGQGAVEMLATMARDRIQGFYAEAATVQKKADIAYFAEKFVPDPQLGGLMRELDPQSREIFLVRDFRDMLCSMSAFSEKREAAGARRTKLVLNEQLIKKQRRGAMGLLHTYQHGADRGLLVRYEDLVLQREKTLEQIFGFLGLEKDTATVADTIRRADDSAVESIRHQTASDPVASIGRWKRDMTPELQQICDECFGDALEAFGYERTSTPEAVI